MEPMALVLSFLFGGFVFWLISTRVKSSDRNYFRKDFQNLQEAVLRPIKLELERMGYFPRLREGKLNVLAAGEAFEITVTSGGIIEVTWIRSGLPNEHTQLGEICTDEASVFAGLFERVIRENLCR